MRVETVICLGDQLAIESPLANAGFVSRNQEDRPALRIERKSHPPFPIGRAEPQLFHIRVARAIQCVDARPPQLRSELLKNARQRQNLRLNDFG